MRSDKVGVADSELIAAVLGFKLGIAENRTLGVRRRLDRRRNHSNESL